MKKFMRHTLWLTACVCMFIGSVTNIWAQNTSDETPIITFKTSIYETYGETNAFHFILGATQNTYIDVDCGYGPMEYEVSQAVFNSETGGIDGTSISCKVSPQGIVKIYGDASLIDYFDAEGCYIRNLDIQALTNLEILSLSHNELEELDLTPHSRLQSLTLNDNPFNVTPLKVGGNKPDLVILDLDIVGNLDPTFNISDYPALISFQAWDTHSLQWIDPTGCPNLVRLSIDATSVCTLDVTQNTKLQILNISDTRISSIDLSNNPLLTELYCTNQSGTINTDVKISSLDLTNNPELYRLLCSGNKLTSIDLSKNPKLFDLIIRDNYLTSIDLSNNQNLYNVYITNNNMDFATLPIDPGTWGAYDYEQRDMPVDPSYPVGHVFDFSDRVLREGTQTYVELYNYIEEYPNNSRKLDESYYTYEDGKVTLLKEFSSDSVYLAFGNSAFPDIMLCTTKFKIKKLEDYGKPSLMAAFSTTLGDGSPISFGIGANGASPENPKELYVDFGDGELQPFTVTTDTIPAVHNINGTKKGWGQISVWTPDGVALSALNAELPIYSTNLKAANSLKYLRLANTGLYSIDLSWNNSLRTLDLSNNNLSYLSLNGVNSRYEKTLLTDINISHNNLSEIELTSNRSFKNLDISYNQFSEFPLKDASQLETLNISHNNFSEINLAYCAPMTKADLSYNQLSSIVFPEEENNIRYLAINNNNFTFASMPQCDGMPLEEYIYAPQNTIPIPTKAPSINLSDQWITVDGHTTRFVWKNEDGATMEPGKDYEIVNGKTTFKNTEMGRIYCEMTHEAFPDLSGENALKTTPVLAAGMPTRLLATFTTPIGGQPVALSFAAAKGSPALYIDWTGKDDLSQYPLNSYTYTRFSAVTSPNATVRVYTYEDDEDISVFSITGATMSSMDASKMTKLSTFTIDEAGLSSITLPESPNLTELFLSGNSFSELDLSRYPNLRALVLNGNKFSSIDLSHNPDLSLLSISGNQFTSLELNSPQLSMLDASNNMLTSISLTGSPNLEELAVNQNQLSDINVDFLTRLKVIFLDRNRFSFASLPQIKPQYARYTYKNQAVIDVEEVDGKIDLSAHRSAYGTDTKYTWYLDMPTFNEYEELEGEELYADDEYVIENGVTQFLTPFNNVVCVMTNEEFPGLYLFTPIMNVKGSSGIGKTVLDPTAVRISMSQQTITVKAAADGNATLYSADGKVINTLRLENGEATIRDIQPGLYILNIEGAAYKLNVR